MPLDRVQLREDLRQRPSFQPAATVDPKKSRRAVIITAIVLGIVAALFVGWHLFVQHMIAVSLSKPMPPTPVTAATADVRIMPKFLTGIGSLQAVHQVTIAPEIGGRIVKIFFEPGATVKEGDPLVQLFDAPERGDLANYQAQAHVAQLNLDRARTLSQRQYESRQAVDQAQSLLDQAQGNIAKFEGQIAQKLIRAPFSGELGVRQVEVGAYVTPGGAIVTLTDLSTLWVNFTLPEQVASRVAVGQTARITADAYPGRSFEGKITAIEPQISASTRTILIQATIANPDHVLLPGMFANVAVALPDKPQMVTVPETAIDYSLYGDAVFLIREEGKDPEGHPILKAVRTPVKLGDRVDGRIEILSGLKAGDQVAASGQVRLANGTRVSIEPSDTLNNPPPTDAY